MVRLHLGCGPNILEEYINIDKFSHDDPRVMKADALKLPYADASVDEIFHQHVIEHLDFHEEKKAFDEWFRVLKTGGRLVFEVLDFEWLCETFLEARDNWKTFYEKEKDHYFGYGINNDQRWSVLIAHFYGNQAHGGQYHKNGYTAGKIRSIFKHYGYSSYGVETFTYDRFDLQCLRATAMK